MSAIALGYVLPMVGQPEFVVWLPTELAMGNYEDAKIVLLSPFPLDDAAKTELHRWVHDWVFRFEARRVPRRIATSWWFRIIWGIINLVGASESGDILRGLYLTVGLPIFANIVEAIWEKSTQQVVRRFDFLVHGKDIEIVPSARLRELTDIVLQGGYTDALHALERLGLREVIEFYRRAAWSRRWATSNMAPHGIGGLCLDRQTGVLKLYGTSSDAT